MADKIPYEVLLPVALELYQKIPQPVEFSVKQIIEKGEHRFIEEEATDFAKFYCSLHNQLIDGIESCNKNLNQP